MTSEQLAILKQELDKQGLAPEQWQKWLEQASQTCSAYVETLRQTEPYAVQTIEWFEEASGELEEISQEPIEN